MRRHWNISLEGEEDVFVRDKICHFSRVGILIRCGVARNKSVTFTVI